ncbi:MAG: Ku protein [Syntrophomonas sp.]|nr:Ku protein [Syntrophomonas sp.]
MAVAHRTVISFGLVAIPVSLYTATQDNDIHFNQLHKEDKSRVRYKKTCAHCKKELKSEDIVKGFEYDKDRYVVIVDEDIEKIKTEKEKSIQILHFAQLNQISPVYYDRTYQAIPEVGGEKAFELLRSALMQEQKVAIGRTIMGTKDTLIAIIPRENGVLISTMFYQNDIKDLQKSYKIPDMNEQELKMAQVLINSMDIPFDPSQYKDEYQAKLKELIETKISGKEVVATKPEQVGYVINLMDALKASIEKQNESKTNKQEKTLSKRTKKEKGA